MDVWLKDLRYAFRVLVGSPVFSVVAILSLGLGIGVNSGVFSVVNAVLLRPLPVSHPEELVEVYATASEGFPYSTNSYPDYLDLRDQNQVFSGLLGHTMTFATYTREGGQSELVFGEIVTGNYFDLLGIPAALGRTFLPEEDSTAGSHPVVVLGHGFWQRRFGSDPAALGRTLKLNGKNYTVVGVAPRSFKGTIHAFSPDLFIPAMMANEVEPVGMQDVVRSPTGTTRLEQRGQRWLFLKGRLNPGVSLAQAQANLDTVMARLAQEYPETNKGRKVNLLSARNVRIHPLIDRALTPAAAVLLGAVSLVLLIACANVANMLLARASARRREIALRLALGASRGQLIRQLLTESLLISVGGGLVGLTLAHGATRLLLSVQPPLALSLSFDIAPDGRVLLFTLVVSLLTGIVFGLAPALQATRPDIVPDLKNETVPSKGGRLRKLGLRNLLVVGQVAVSLLLLIGAGLMLRSLQVARSIDLGFNPQGLALITVELEMHGYSREDAKAFFAKLSERLSSLPTVQSATLATRIPFSLNINRNEVFPEGYPREPDKIGPVVDVTFVDEMFFKTLGIPLLEGRDFSEQDDENAPQAVIVSSAFAKRFWPHESAIGKRIVRRDGPAYEVIGVSRDYKVVTVGEEPRPYLHYARAQHPEPYATLLVRTSGAAAGMVATLRRELLTLEPELAFLESKTMTEQMEVPLFPVRMGAALLAGFGAFALVLAAVGLYGVIAYSVSRRTREIGIRMALGASRADVLQQVVLQGMTLALAGTAIGISAAVVASRVLSAVLYGVSAVDPLAFAAASLVLLTVALLANYFPARRAARVDPMAALRYE